MAAGLCEGNMPLFAERFVAGLRMWVFGSLLSLAGCGGGGSEGGCDTVTPPAVQAFSVGGSVTGLSGTVVLQDNGKDNLSVQSNGPFQFAARLPAGSSFAVTVLTQPTDQTCKLDGASGTVSTTVASISISCSENQYAIGGTVSGLIRPITLQNNLGDNLTLSTDGPFVFPGKIDAHRAYSVTVLTPPPGLTCTVAGNAGTVAADVNDVSIICSADPDSYFVPFNAVGQYTSNSPIYIGPWPPPTNGTNALIAVATNTPGAPPTTIATGLTETIGVTQKLMLDSHGTITAGALSTLVYATQAATGGDHLWAVDLSGGSHLTPRQLSNLTVPFIGVLACSKLEVYENFNDPDSAFFILGLPPDSQNRCASGVASFNNILVRLSDSSSATPRSLPSFLHRLLPLYNPTGALAGF